ncbi:MAG: hypothetical protein HRU25_17405 [Psychrobium sp.]|nr:hypothetical protein [Psychrobium sp.]
MKLSNWYYAKPNKSSTLMALIVLAKCMAVSLSALLAFSNADYRAANGWIFLAARRWSLTSYQSIN